jgi:hypothetical protein
LDNKRLDANRKISKITENEFERPSSPVLEDPSTTFMNTDITDRDHQIFDDEDEEDVQKNLALFLSVKGGSPKVFKTLSKE